MTLKSNDHKVAQIIKGLEDRIADLEEKDRNVGTPNVLRTQHDQAQAGDLVSNVGERQLTSLAWNDVDISGHLYGYGTIGYTVGGYGGPVYDPEHAGSTTETSTAEGYGGVGYNSYGYGEGEVDGEGTYKGYGEMGFGEGGFGELVFDDGSSGGVSGDDYGEGGYQEGGYGGYTGTMWTLPARSGWGTATWETYSGALGNLLVETGTTYTIPSGDSETYRSADIDGVVEVNGTLETTG